MHQQLEKPIDNGKPFDWGKTSQDYAQFRAGYPDSLYVRLQALGVGLPEQKVLDLGTGTGLVARALAQRGCDVTAIDTSEQQLETARELAAMEATHVTFKNAAAEDTGLADSSFDVIIAAQAWVYFDQARTIAEVKRLLAPGGVLVTCHAMWLPRQDKITRDTEALVLQFNPDWSGADYSGDVPTQPKWSVDSFEVVHHFWYDEPMLFNRESWRGRIRACRGVGASLDADKVEAFDQALAEQLEVSAPPAFSVLHRIDAHLFKPRA